MKSEREYQEDGNPELQRFRERGHERNSIRGLERTCRSVTMLDSLFLYIYLPFQFREVR